MKVLIVGGEEKYTKAGKSLHDNLAREGFDTIGHQGGKGKSPILNGLGGAEAVISLSTDTGNHGLSRSAKQLCAQNGVPYVSTSRKWSVMLPAIRTVLENHGIPMPNSKLGKAEHEMKEKTSSHHSPALEKLIQKQEDDEAVRKNDQVVEATTLILEEKPHLVLSIQSLSERVVAFLEDGMRAKDIEHLVEKTAEVERRRWKADGARGGSHTPERLARRDKLLSMKVNWVRSVIEKDTSKLPSSRSLEEAGRRIFGSTIDRGVIRNELNRAKEVHTEKLQQPQRVVVDIQTISRPEEPRKYRAMKKLWEVCQEADVTPHSEAVQYFQKNGYPEGPTSEDGITIHGEFLDVTELPTEDITSVATHVVIRTRMVSPGDDVEEDCSSGDHDKTG